MKSIGKHIWAFAVSIASKLYDSTGSSGSPKDSVNVDLSSSSTGYGKTLTTDGKQIYWTNATYIHTQSSVSDTWTAAHKLNRFPSVTVVDSGGNVVIGTVVYNSANKLTITFFSGGDALAFSGKAYLN